jgi:hypothetical protein
MISSTDSVLCVEGIKRSLRSSINTVSNDRLGNRGRSPARASVFLLASIRTDSGPLGASDPLDTRVEVCTGLGLVAQIRFLFEPVQMIANKLKENTSGFIVLLLFFGKEKALAFALNLCWWQSRALETNNTELVFSGIFVAAISQKQFWMTTHKLGTPDLRTVPRTPK